MINQAYDDALNICRQNSASNGFVASAKSSKYGHQIWARDSGIIIYNLPNDKELDLSAKNSLLSLAKFQTPKGLIPCNVNLKENRADFEIEGGLDGTSWFVIASAAYFRRTNDNDFLKQILPSINKAVEFLSYQDPTNLGLVEQQPASDWMDGTLQRWGRTLYQNVLYYQALKDCRFLNSELGIKIEDKSKELLERIQDVFWPTKEGMKRLPITKYHEMTRGAYSLHINPKRDCFVMANTYDRWEEYFDTMANALAILFDVATSEQKKKIVRAVKTRKICYPAPARAIDPAVLDLSIYREDRDKRLQKQFGNKFEHWQNYPYWYHNSGIWPMVGGILIAAIAKVDKKYAKEQLEKLAELNLKNDFNEWFYGYAKGLPLPPKISHMPKRKSLSACGQKFQTWSASAYVYAYNSLKI